MFLARFEKPYSKEFMIVLVTLIKTGGGHTISKNFERPKIIEEIKYNCISVAGLIMTIINCSLDSDFQISPSQYY